jgi:hypothetical protein
VSEVLPLLTTVGVVVPGARAARQPPKRESLGADWTPARVVLRGDRRDGGNLAPSDRARLRTRAVCSPRTRRLQVLICGRRVQRCASPPAPGERHRIGEEGGGTRDPPSGRASGTPLSPLLEYVDPRRRQGGKVSGIVAGVHAVERPQRSRCGSSSTPRHVEPALGFRKGPVHTLWRSRTRRKRAL